MREANLLLTLLDTMKDDEITCRYEESGTTARIQIWGDAYKPRTKTEPSHTITAPIDEMPQWVKDIRSVAVVGGFMPVNPHPPPKYILWFYIDVDHNLRGFVPNVY